MIEIIATGPLTTVQDDGRPGWAAVGVSRSGAADRASAALANRLVGNEVDAAVLEVTLGGLHLRVDAPTLVALTGAPCPATVDDHGVAMTSPVHVPAGGTLRLGAPRTGLRTYVAVRGGIAVPAVLGSRATDVLTGVGPPVVRAGDVLPVGTSAAAVPGVDHAPVREPERPAVLTLGPGPRADWFVGDALAALASGTYTVGTASNRTALRLDGAGLTRAHDRELPSEGLVPGAVQVPPDGRPVVFLRDHPITGGYPVVAVVTAASLDRAAQLRPGDEIRFRVGRTIGA
jgi:biotin-dependent carboxylase-like uncharacterized protein